VDDGDRHESHAIHGCLSWQLTLVLAGVIGMAVTMGWVEIGSGGPVRKGRVCGLEGQDGSILGLPLQWSHSSYLTKRYRRNSEWTHH